MMRLTLPNFLCRAAILAAVLALYQPVQAGAEDQPPPPQGVSRGENFSAKPPAQLFASDCTGAGCHKGPQGLGRKGLGIGGLAGFLREHYTNSRESAAALANYLSGIPTGPAPKAAERPKPGAKPSATASAPSGLPNWFESTTESRPAPNEHKPREATHTPPGRNSQTASKPEKPEAKPEGLMKEEPSAATEKANEPESSEKSGEAAAKPEPSNRRAQRGRHPAATAANASAPPAAAPAAEPEPAQAPAAPSPPAPKQYDIFD
jgi:hypothetical protein